MAKTPTKKDQTVMDVLKTTISRCPVGDVSEVGALMQNPTEMHYSWLQMCEDDEILSRQFGSDELRKRWLKIKRIARKQAHDLLEAAEVILEKKDLDENRTIEALTNSRKLGVKLASVGEFFNDYEYGTKTADEMICAAAKKYPERYIEFVPGEPLSLQFTPEGIELGREHRGLGIGCSALAETVEHPEHGRVNLFNAYWDYLAAEYIADRNG